MLKKTVSATLALVMVLSMFTMTASAATANPTASTVLVDGKNVAFDAYNINDNNYFKLRDLAYTLNGTAKQFEVGWDGANNAISLTSGQAYTIAGGEMTGKGGGAKEAAPTDSRIYLNGREVQFTAYNIDGNNYFKLRDIGEAFNFGVDWDGARNTIVIDTDKGYSLDGGATTPSILPAPAPTPEPTAPPVTPSEPTPTPPPPKESVDPDLIGTWKCSYYNTRYNAFFDRYYFFNADGTFEHSDGNGYEAEGKYSSSGGKVYLTNIVWRDYFRGENMVDNTRVDAVLEYEFVTAEDGRELLKIYALSQNHERSSFSLEGVIGYTRQ